jgi:hypothetical protein
MPQASGGLSIGTGGPSTQYCKFTTVSGLCDTEGRRGAIPLSSAMRTILTDKPIFGF